MRTFLTITILLVIFFPKSGSMQNAHWRYCSKLTENISVLIENNSNTEVNISNIISACFFTNIDSVVNYINKEVHHNGFEKDYQKAWLFMLNYAWASKAPLSDDSRYNQPVQFLNSTGWGFCGNKSRVLAAIWTKMGYQVRVWDLSGHVVPEIKINGNWEVWDPTYQIFYTDSNNIPAGVEKLGAYPSLITKPNKIAGLQKSVWSRIMGNSRNLASLYSSTSDNECFYINERNNENYDKFFLPPNSKIIFPYYSNLPLNDLYHKDTIPQRNYAELVLFIEPGYCGRIYLPLILHGICSEGSQLCFQSKEYIFNKNQTTLVTHGFNLPSQIDIAFNTKGIQFFFLINPLVMQRLIVTGKNLTGLSESSGIEIKYIKLPAKNQINVIYLKDIQGPVKINKISLGFVRWFFRN